MFDWLRSERGKYATRLKGPHSSAQPGLPQFDARSRELFEKALPRGVLMPRLDADRERVNYWMSPAELMRHHSFVPGQIILGKIGNCFLGHLDDRPIATIAGPRAGKTTTSLEPNIYLYPGSALIMDPKGELARTASFRRAIGHDVYVLDAFGQSGQPSASFNPLAELDPDDDAIIDDVMSIVNALVIDDGDGRSQHFSDGARVLLRGLILLTLTLPPAERHLITVRELLCLSYWPLAEAARVAAARKRLAQAKQEEKEAYFDENTLALKALLNRMESIDNKFDGVLAGIGKRFKNTPPGERGSIFSTAAMQTDFLDSIVLRKILRHSDFKLATLRGDKPATIFMCLPVGRMQQHARWMRMIIQLTCTVLERLGPYPRTRPPILFMMEEFATLGHMEIMERAAAYFPGFGVKLWVVLQSLEQLSRYYPKSYQTFLSNALIQVFAAGDDPALEYIARRLGNLITPFELRMAFSRERFSQLLLMEGLPPAAALRLDHNDVAMIREQAATILGLPRLS
jgi:type IV secretion system protein VirD4